MILIIYFYYVKVNVIIIEVSRQETRKKMNINKQTKYLAEANGDEAMDLEYSSKTSRGPPKKIQKSNNSNKLAYLLHKSTKASGSSGGGGSPALLFVGNL